MIAAFAHWQNGKTERHGDILQHMLEKFDVNREIKTDLEFRQALRLCCQAKNSLARSKGYTPEILVLGKSRKMPGSLCEGHADPDQYLADSESPEVSPLDNILNTENWPEKHLCKLTTVIV